MQHEVASKACVNRGAEYVSYCHQFLLRKVSNSQNQLVFLALDYISSWWLFSPMKRINTGPIITFYCTQ